MSDVSSLSAVQRSLIDEIVDALEPVAGLQGVALGGSHARGLAVPDSDIDLGLYYSDASPLCIESIRDIASRLSSDIAPIVSELYEWGPWVNGGAWLTIDGQRVDFLYRSLEQLDRTIEAAEQGNHELHFGQQPPFGFFGPTYLGELSIAIPLVDASGQIARLQGRVVEYPEALRTQVVQDYLWSVEFGLNAFASKFARRGEVFLTSSTIARSAHGLTLVLFALNRRYLVNDKTSLAEIMDFPLHPDDFRERIESLLSSVGSKPSDLQKSVETMQSLFADVAALAGDLYTAKYDLS